MSDYSAHPMSAAAHEALGAIEAQQVVDGLRDGTLTPVAGWLRFVEVNARLGRNSPAVRAFVVALLKRVGPA